MSPAARGIIALLARRAVEEAMRAAAEHELASTPPAADIESAPIEEEHESLGA